MDVCSVFLMSVLNHFNTLFCLWRGLYTYQVFEFPLFVCEVFHFLRTHLCSSGSFTSHQSFTSRGHSSVIHTYTAFLFHTRISWNHCHAQCICFHRVISLFVCQCLRLQSNDRFCVLLCAAETQHPKPFIRGDMKEDWSFLNRVQASVIDKPCNDWSGEKSKWETHIFFPLYWYAGAVLLITLLCSPDM